jgi:hypothetical protein
MQLVRWLVGLSITQMCSFHAAIEGMKSRMDGAGGSEETVSDHGPVLEELMPLKPSLSVSSEEHESSGGAGKREEAAETPDWLRSVQLWSQEPQQRPSSPSSPRKVCHNFTNRVVWFVLGLALEVEGQVITTIAHHLNSQSPHRSRCASRWR